MRSSIRGINPEWYRLEGDKDEPEPVEFYLKPLNGFGRSEVSMLSLSSRSGVRNAAVVASSDVINLAFQLGVKNWRNIEDGDKPGEQLQFSRTAMDSMREGWIIEVGARVLEISEVGVKESKNSDSPSS